MVITNVIFSFLSWFCHLDDDVYVIMDNLVKLLSMMDPKTEARYIGKPLSPWKRPYVVSSSVYIPLKYHKYNIIISYFKKGIFLKMTILKSRNTN